MQDNKTKNKSKQLTIKEKIKHQIMCSSTPSLAKHANLSFPAPSYQKQI